MTSHSNDDEKDDSPLRSESVLPVPFFRFVESTMAHLEGARDFAAYRKFLPSIIASLNAAYVISAQRSDSAFALPIAKLTAADIVSGGWISDTVENLMEKTAAGSVYRISSRGETPELLFPLWQFVGAAPRLIEQILPHFIHAPSSEVHAFFVSTSDELNELAPAEMLAGIPFETRGCIDPSQIRYLEKEADERVRRVIRAAGHSNFPT